NLCFRADRPSHTLHGFRPSHLGIPLVHDCQHVPIACRHLQLYREMAKFQDTIQLNKKRSCQRTVTEPPKIFSTTLCCAFYFSLKLISFSTGYNVTREVQTV